MLKPISVAIICLTSQIAHANNQISTSQLKFRTPESLTGIMCDYNGENRCVGSIGPDKKIYSLYVPYCNAPNATNNNCEGYQSRIRYGSDPVVLVELFRSQSNSIAATYPTKSQRVDSIENCGEVPNNTYYECKVNYSVYRPDLQTWSPNGWNMIGGNFVPPSTNICGNNQPYLPTLGCFNNAPNMDDSSNRTVAATCQDPTRPQIGNPVDIVTGAKIDAVEDINYPISFTRSYSSTRNKSDFTGVLGKGWRHNYDKRLKIIPSADTAILEMEDGTQVYFKKSGTEYATLFNDNKQYKIAELKTGTTVTGYQVTTPSLSVETFDLDGNLISVNRGGYVLNLSYTAGKLMQITDSYNRSVNFTYTADLLTGITSAADSLVYTYTNGDMTRVSRNSALVANYTYDTAHNLTSKTNSKNEVIGEYSYDLSSRAVNSRQLTSSTEYANQMSLVFNNSQITATQEGAVKTYTKTQLANSQQLVNQVSYKDGSNQFTYSNISYNSDGTIYSQSDSNDNYYTYTYEDGIYPKTMVMNYRITHTYVWDKVRNLLLSDTTSATGMNVVKTFTYDSWGRPTLVTYTSSSGNRSESMTYNAQGKILTSTDIFGATTSYEYYTTGSYLGLLKKITAPMGQTIEVNSYDTRGNATSVASNGITLSYTYNDKSQMLTSTKTTPSVTATDSYIYDADGLLLTKTLSNGYIMTMTYDRLGRVKSVEDNLAQKITMTYDGLGNITNRSVYEGTALFTSLTSTYDTLGRQTAMWRQADKKYTYTYNNFRLSTERNPLNQDKNYYYERDILKGESSYTEAYSQTLNDAGLVAQNYVNNNNSYTYTYNDFAEILTAVSPNTGTTTYSRDIANRTETSTDANGAVHTTTSNLAGQMTESKSIKGTTTLIDTFNYNTKGLLTGASNTNTSVTYTYNDQLLPATKSQDVSGTLKTLSYGYNATGELTSITYPSGKVVTLTRVKGQIKAIDAGTANILSNISYSPNGVRSYNFNTMSTYTKLYTDGLVTGISSPQLNYNYTHDKIDNISSWNDGNALSNYMYEYGKITSKTSTNGNATYTYTSKNNRYSSDIAGNSKYYNHQADRITNINGTISTTYTYDNNGNTLTENLKNFTYDLKNNTTSIYSGSDVVSYKYNAMKERVEKTRGVDKTVYIYDNQKLMGEYDNAGNYTEYIYLGDMLVAINKDNTIYYVHNDHLNTSRKVTNGSGTVVFDWNNSDPFGGNAPTVNTIGFNIRYPGQYYDAESEYHYNYYRYYNPRTGKYLQADPIGLAGGLNVYNYTNNDSLNYADPLGLEAYMIYIKDNIVKFDHVAFMVNNKVYGIYPQQTKGSGAYSQAISKPEDISEFDTRYLDLDRFYRRLNLTKEQEIELVKNHNNLSSNPNYKYSIFDEAFINLQNAAQCSTHIKNVFYNSGLTKIKGFRPSHIYESSSVYGSEEIHMQPWKNWK